MYPQVKFQPGDQGTADYHCLILYSNITPWETLWYRKQEQLNSHVQSVALLIIHHVSHSVIVTLSTVFFPIASEFLTRVQFS